MKKKLLEKSVQMVQKKPGVEVMQGKGPRSSIRSRFESDVGGAFPKRRGQKPRKGGTIRTILHFLTNMDTLRKRDDQMTGIKKKRDENDWVEQEMQRKRFKRRHDGIYN